MSNHHDTKKSNGKYWFVGFFALLWLVLRSGENPKRLTYPCQQAALPLAFNWILTLAAFFTGSILLRKFVKNSPLVIFISGIIWFTLSLPGDSNANLKTGIRPPVWEVPNPISKVFVLDSIPSTKGSLAAGNATVPDSCLVDPAIDTLFMMLSAKGVYIHKTTVHPNGIVGSNNVVIIKGNFQWTGKVSTSTDRIKGLIWQILKHPAGFTGEIIVCDNTQGYSIDQNDNNSEDPNQSIVNVVNTFRAKGYPVYLRDWKNLMYVAGVEYNQGNYNDCYIYEPPTKISYPKFRSSSGKYLISLRYGIWDSLASVYDSARLCIINFPVLKHHGMSGATVAIKNWIGVMSVEWANERYGGWTEMHYNYLFNQYALVSRIMAVTYPRLSIVDAAWTSAAGNTTPDYVVNTKVLLASTDPVAVSWYAAKFVLTPIAYNKSETNPDLPGGKYNVCLANWTNFLRDSAGLACTKDSNKISVYGRESLLQTTLPAIPQLLSPANGATNQPRILNLNWNESSSALFYHLQLSADSLFSSRLIDDSTLTATSYRVEGLFQLTTYYWRVRAKNSAGQSDFSSVSNFTTGNSITMSVQLNNGWNLLSVPLTVNDASLDAIFPNAISRAFSFDSTNYHIRDSLKNGFGYWVKFPTNTPIEISGAQRLFDTIIVNKGWNMIGSISTPVAVSSINSIPSNITISKYYGYQAQYSTADTIYPGRGYWIKVQQAGSLVISTSQGISSVSIKE